MTNGKTGDHPVNDILDHGIAVFSPEADALIHEIASYISRQRMWDLFDWFSPPPIGEFTRQLRETRDRLHNEARDRGWQT